MATSKATSPTQEDLCEDRLKKVHRESDDSWRHGCRIYEVYHRESDDTYWAVNYNLQTDGEYNGLRENDYTIEQVERIEETVVQVSYKGISA